MHEFKFYVHAFALFYIYIYIYIYIYSGNENSLYQSIKEKQATTDHMFEPLGEIMEMMRHYGVVIPEETLVQFQGNAAMQLMAYTIVTWKCRR